MPVRIRRANLQTDRMALIEMFRRYLTPQSNAKRFEWLYRHGPHGEALTWVACDVTTDEIVGAASAFPRKLYWDGKEKLGVVLGDFCMHERYRSLGPSLQLQRACLGVVDEHPFEFLYDFPSTSMMAIYTRLGIQQTGTLFRWAKPLRADARIEASLHSKTLAKGISFLVNAMLARRGWKGEKSACEVELHEGPCDDEFDRLNQRLQTRAGVQTARTAGYLNWRYFEHPRTVHEIIKAWRQGSLIGFVVYTKDPEDASIVDLSSTGESAVVAQLLAAAVERLRSLGATTVSLNAGDAHPWNEGIDRAGFWRREASPVVVYSQGASAISSRDFQHNWHLMRGERDS
jgi:hypothetical protein